MFNKLKSLAEESIAAGKEKLAEGTEAAVTQFLAELRDLQPLLAKANIKFGGYRVTISVPPNFELLSDPSMDWNLAWNEKAFEGITLSKYQELIISALRQASTYSKQVNACGFEIGKIDFKLSVPPSVVIDIRPKPVAITT